MHTFGWNFSSWLSANKHKDTSHSWVYFICQTNMQRTVILKLSKYSSLVSDLLIVKWCLLISPLVLWWSCISKTIPARITTKALNISIRFSYYIFHLRNKPWSKNFHLFNLPIPLSVFFWLLLMILYSLCKEANYTLPCAREADYKYKYIYINI